MYRNLKMDHSPGQLEKIDDAIRHLGKEVPLIGENQLSHKIVESIIKELSDMWGYPDIYNEHVFALSEYYKLYDKGFPHLRRIARAPTDEGKEKASVPAAQHKKSVQPTSQDRGEVFVSQSTNTFGYYHEYGEPEGDTGADLLYCQGVGSPR